MSDSGADGFFEEDEPLEEIFERFTRGERGLTSVPPGGQALPSGQFVAIWPSPGHYAPDENALVQA
ncbi:MAG: hypothetical protein ACYCVN_07145 [Acidimicrobiales bacterium]